MEKQILLAEQKIVYSYGAYNKWNDEEQWIRVGEGCPHNCPYCYEPTENKLFGIPKIIRNRVKIMDMNLLAKPEALDIITELGEKKVNERVVYYELICGVDYRFLTQDIANALKKSRFRRMRFAWDWEYNVQFKIKDALDMLLKAGYRNNDLMAFMICNWKIPYEECLKKLDLLKVWNVKIADCYFDGQRPPIQPVHWSAKQIKDFRSKCRKHNQLVNFKIDPELK